MSKRSELRRMQREAEKRSKTTVLSPRQYGTQEQVMKDFNLSVQGLQVYLERMEKQMKEDFQKEYEEKLHEAEEYASVANLLITIYALKMSRKNREHTKDLIQRMLDNYNPATAYIKRVGAKEAYKRAHADFDITLEFDSDKMNKEFGFGHEEEEKL